MRVDLVRETEAKDLAYFCIYSEPVGLGGHTLQREKTRGSRGGRIKSA